MYGYLREIESKLSVTFQTDGNSQTWYNKHINGPSLRFTSHVQKFMKSLEKRSQKKDEKERAYFIIPGESFQDGSLFTASTKRRHRVKKLQARDNKFIMRAG
jgi:hypothetical protein